MPTPYANETDPDDDAEYTGVPISLTCLLVLTAVLFLVGAVVLQRRKIPREAV